jgi:hypothetical protein
MAFTNDIILNTITYARIITGRSSGTWSNPAAVLNGAETIRISHETAKSGRVNSVAQFQQDYLDNISNLCTVSPTTRSSRVLLKISYDPKSNSATLKADLEAQRDQLILLLNDATRWSKFVNQEA